MLAGDARFVIELLPLPVARTRDGWAIDCAANTLATSGDLGRVFAKAKLTWRAS